MKILWVFDKIGPHSSTFHYSASYIDRLRCKGHIIDTIQTPPILECKAGYPLRILVRSFLLLIKSKKYDWVVLSAEASAYLVPFIRTESCMIVHHVIDNMSCNVRFREKIDRWYLKKFICRFNAIVTASNLTSSHLKEYRYLQNFSHCLVIPNSFDLVTYEQFQLPLTQEKLFSHYQIPYSKDTRYLLYVGYEIHRKNFITLLHLMSRVRNQNYHLIKIGGHADKNNRERHLKYIHENKLQNITFVDRVPLKDLMSFYQICFAFLFPSLYEGFGRPPIEAQASGTPVISTKAGALEEVLVDSALIINEPTNIQEWENALLKLEDKEVRSRFVRSGKKNAQRFALERNVRLWEDVFGTRKA